MKDMSNYTGQENVVDVKPQVNISVRNLVEFLLRNGDIDKTKATIDSTNAMREGQKIHRKIQSHMPSSYHPEVPLKFIYSYSDYDLAIEGRADGVIYDMNTIVAIDEIKGVYRDLDKLEEADVIHLAQAKCYGAITSIQNDLDSIEIQITYCNIDTGQIKRFKENYSKSEIEGFFYDLIEKYKRWSDFRYFWIITRNESINNMTFPFEYRVGQKALMSEVYNHVEEKRNLFIQAPTGTGKTIATLYPTLKQMGENKVSRIMYLTAKTITKSVAKGTVELLHDNDGRFKVTEITAREKICPQDEIVCDPLICPYAKGHYDRINDILYETLIGSDLFNRDIICEKSHNAHVCPYELSLDLAYFSDLIICDYNYAFDPNVVLANIFSDLKTSEYALLIDEAHNLVDRAREMYSESLVKEEILYFKKLFNRYDSKLGKYFDKINKILLAYKKECEHILILNEIDELILALLRLSNRLESFFDKKIDIKEQDEVLEFYFKILNFLNICSYLDDKYCIYCELVEDGRFVINLFCVDPSFRLSEYMESVRSCILFSATLLPINYYKQLLTCEVNPDAIYAHSVFDPDKRLLLIADDVTSKYSKRNLDEFQKYALYIKKITDSKKGNYIVFSPSYSFMEKVYEQYIQLDDEKECILQETYMDEDKRDEFLRGFKLKRDISLVAFCVLGGIFSEGIDLTNDSLIGVIIIGTGLAQINTRLNLLSDYFSKHEKNGFDFAYRFPGMNKVMQAAGRVIRTVEDTGIIALLDERFLFSETRVLFPKEWSNYKKTNLNIVDNQIKKFYEDLD